MLNNTEKLFSYGTLRYETVQMATFGRKLSGTADVLRGYSIAIVKIQDSYVVETSGEAEHKMLVPGKSADKVPGMVFEISAEELAHADQYEDVAYQRLAVKLESGVTAWVYVSATA